METPAKFRILLVVVALATTVGVAQQPEPAGVPGTVGTEQTVTQPELVRDPRPVTSLQELSAGVLPGEHYSWGAELQVVQMWDSNVLIDETSRSASTPVSAIQGVFSIDRQRGRNTLLLSYGGGSARYRDYSVLDSTYHDLGLSETYNWRRWSLTLADQFNVVPASMPGSFGIPSIPLGVGLPSQIQSGNTVDISVITRATRLTNTGVVEVSHSLTDRTSISFGGTAGVLRFLREGFVNTNQGGASAGIDHQLTRNDNIGLSYEYTIAAYPEAKATLGGHTVEVAYARQLNRRMLFRLSAGPHATDYSDNAGSSQQLFVNGRIALSARFARADFALHLAHDNTGGAGAMSGAKRNLAALSVRRDFPRFISFEMGGGIARNSALATGVNFNSTYVGGSVRHYFGRFASLYFTYNMQRQTGLGNASTNSFVPVNLNRNVYGVGLSFGLSPRMAAERPRQ